MDDTAAELECSYIIHLLIITESQLLRSILFFRLGVIDITNR